jgi:pSer/pThr/pTyr-binding forkhead associated (FHA) protein
VEGETSLAAVLIWVAAAVLVASASVLLGGTLVRWQRARTRFQSALDHAAPLLVPFPESRVAVRARPRMLTPAAREGPTSWGEPAPAPLRTVARADEPPATATPNEWLSTIRLERPADTLQVLPGRLEVLEGDDAREIRLFRGWDDVPEVTIGRSAGSDHRHVQLRSLTVSRAHARLRFEGERWRILNLSDTNPTLVNGEVLEPRERRQLAHGDRIELGAVALRFWER